MIHLLRQFDPTTPPPETGGGVEQWTPRCSSSCFASTGRSLVAFLVDTLGLSSDHTCLIPAYVPEGVVQPLRMSGIRVDFYRVDHRLFADPERLSRQVEKDPSVRLVVLIHPFGFEQPVRPIRDMLSGRGIAILEDCAQALLSRTEDGTTLGQEGDFSLFSLNKFLPVPDGAVLQSHCRGTSVDCGQLARGPEGWRESILAYEEHLRLNHALLTSTSPDRRLLEETGEAYERYYSFVNRELGLSAPSDVTLDRLRRLAPGAMAEARRRNCALLYAGLKQTTFRFVYPQWDDRTVPMAVPVRVRPEERERIADRLFERNILLSTLVDKWNFIPPGRESAFPAESEFMASHLLVPVNEFLSSEEMEYMVATMNQI
ncbi:DegT/DnrJ/EryC1/StrS aminotransferase family protein [Pseudodesulfovibrio hydrargyri]|uniref:DegT/DnrJ/EryC1/StrS aminotransferase family protein n=1 Tax=Pseudodesulfovibrio hydrargyri TaxID=2125990 RepID=A0A1J5N0R9_9BACT|nr:DegT/DnrJ/EryC1/StrS family aminotransferase [Pseudodesulfovibrio hydrargyri]OIQ49235.1 DegT/DnrJ/EryC1/StrS aminotransferase family protein [Pseudodesulfovibrio hydrargyri]